MNTCLLYKKNEIPVDDCQYIQRQGFQMALKLIKGTGFIRKNQLRCKNWLV